MFLVAGVVIAKDKSKIQPGLITVSICLVI